MRLSVGIIALAFASATYASPIIRREGVQDLGNSLKGAADVGGLTDAHNAADAYLDGSLKSFEDHSGLTQASNAVGIQPFGKAITRRDAVQDVGRGAKILADNAGLTDAHNAADAYLEGSVKSFENESGLTEASAGFGVQPVGKPITKRDAIQDVGNGAKSFSDHIGLTDAHNAVDSYFDGSLKSFEDNSGLTQASVGLGVQPFGKPVTKRDVLSLAEIEALSQQAQDLYAQFQAAVAALKKASLAASATGSASTTSA